MIELSEQIRELKSGSLLKGVELEWITPEEIERPYCELLVHERDMTSTLARFHGAEIGLEVLQEGHRGCSYVREVILSAGMSAVEYGIIEISLDLFDSEVREKIVGGGAPLGSILNGDGVEYQSQPQGYFRICSSHFSPSFFSKRGGEFLFGRYNNLSNSKRGVLARILEILP